MPVYKWSRFLAHSGRDGTDEPTEGSTRGPRGPKKRFLLVLLFDIIFVVRGGLGVNCTQEHSVIGMLLKSVLWQRLCDVDMPVFVYLCVLIFVWHGFCCYWCYWWQYFSWWWRRWRAWHDWNAYEEGDSESTTFHRPFTIPHFLIRHQGVEVETPVSIPFLPCFALLGWLCHLTFFIWRKGARV